MDLATMIAIHSSPHRNLLIFFERQKFYVNNKSVIPIILSFKIPRPKTLRPSSTFNTRTKSASFLNLCTLTKDRQTKWWWVLEVRQVENELFVWTSPSSIPLLAGSRPTNLVIEDNCDFLRASTSGSICNLVKRQLKGPDFNMICSQGFGRSQAQQVSGQSKTKFVRNIT